MLNVFVCRIGESRAGTSPSEASDMPSMENPEILALATGEGRALKGRILMG